MTKLSFAFLPLILTAFFLSDADRMTCNSVSAHSVQQDGPYVSYSGEEIQVRYIMDDHGTAKVLAEKYSLSQKKDIILRVATDDPAKSFTVKLKDQLSIEKSSYTGAEKQFVLSDIEGNIGAFRKLLQGNGIIDSAFNWTFGNGHLVLIGDFVDRGEQVTEVLWLIYSLEDKAKAAGGMLHYVLGNHEIMIMSGDRRYINNKYKSNTDLLREGYTSLFGDNTELGRWMRTKNIIEKVDNMLYVHAGIAPEINSLGSTLEAINDLTRPYYADSSNAYPDQKLLHIYGKNSPFWYRGYYVGTERASQSQVDSTLAIYGVKHIVTGHSIVADMVTTHFNSKVINTDLEHAKGKSGALLIEGGKLYRVDPKGEKQEL